MQNSTMIVGQIIKTIAVMMLDEGQLRDASDSGVAFVATANHASGVVIKNSIKMPLNA